MTSIPTVAQFLVFCKPKDNTVCANTDLYQLQFHFSMASDNLTSSTSSTKTIYCVECEDVPAAVICDQCGGDAFCGILHGYYCGNTG